MNRYYPHRSHFSCKSSTFCTSVGIADDGPLPRFILDSQLINLVKKLLCTLILNYLCPCPKSVLPTNTLPYNFPTAFGVKTKPSGWPPERISLFDTFNYWKHCEIYVLFMLLIARSMASLGSSPGQTRLAASSRAPMADELRCWRWLALNPVPLGLSVILVGIACYRNTVWDGHNCTFTDIRYLT